MIWVSFADDVAVAEPDVSFGSLESSVDSVSVDSVSDGSAEEEAVEPSV